MRSEAPLVVGEGVLRFWGLTPGASRVLLEKLQPQLRDPSDSKVAFLTLPDSACLSQASAEGTASSAASPVCIWQSLQTQSIATKAICTSRLLTAEEDCPARRRAWEAFKSRTSVLLHRSF